LGSDLFVELFVAILKIEKIVAIIVNICFKMRIFLQLLKEFKKGKKR